MTHRGPFQPQTFCDSVFAIDPRPSGLVLLIYICIFVEVRKMPTPPSLSAALPVVEHRRMSKPVHIVVETRAGKDSPPIAS